MLDNLANMVDVEKAECAVHADKVREMKNLREGATVETVNALVAGAVIGWVACTLCHKTKD